MTGEKPLPVVISQRSQRAGETLYMATDETWRWQLTAGVIFSLTNIGFNSSACSPAPGCRDHGEGATLGVQQAHRAPTRLPSSACASPMNCSRLAAADEQSRGRGVARGRSQERGSRKPSSCSRGVRWMTTRRWACLHPAGDP